MPPTTQPRLRIPVDDVVITVESQQGWPWIRYSLLSALSWAILIFDGGYVRPDPPYRIVVRDIGTGVSLYEEGGLLGQAAFDEARQFADDIRRIGIDDFVFKRSHGWRID